MSTWETTRGVERHRPGETHWRRYGMLGLRARVIAEQGQLLRWAVTDDVFFSAVPLAGGESSFLGDAQEACDSAAVAMALIELVKRAAAWATEIDARLAREYRAANFAEPWSAARYQATHYALLRGCP